MEFWQRVTIQSVIRTASGSGARIPAWASYAEDVEARVIAATTETADDWSTSSEDMYEIQLRGLREDIQPSMRVLVEGEPFDIKRIVIPPPFATPTTTLLCVKVTP